MFGKIFFSCPDKGVTAVLKSLWVLNFAERDLVYRLRMICHSFGLPFQLVPDSDSQLIFALAASGLGSFSARRLALRQ